MSTHRCFNRLIDDAAIFPPGNAPLATAVADHHEHRGSAHAWLVGPLLVRDRDIAELEELNHQPLQIGVIATSGPAELHEAVRRAASSRHLTVIYVEIAVPAHPELRAATIDLLGELAWAKEGPVVSIELPLPGAEVTAAWTAAVDAIGAAGHQVKLRTGGTSAEAHPGEADLATALAALVGRRRRFKLTAGLHRAVRNTQTGTGFEQHGFLNVLVAVRALLSGASSEEASVILTERDQGVLAAIVAAWDADQMDAVREIFRGFGSCSVGEPYGELVALGLAE